MTELLRTTLLVLLCCFGPLAAQDRTGEAGREREAGVLAVLRKLDALEQSWLPMSSFRITPSPLGCPQVLPHIPISCGNSRMGVFDATRARRLARELFAVYRLDAKADVPVREPGVEAVLDGYAAGRKVGFELRGIAPPTPGMEAEALLEDAGAGLDDGELAKLRQAGIRVHIADLKNYPLMDLDQYTPTLAWLASVVAFLDEVTDGRGVPLDAVLWQRRQRFPLGPLPEAKGVAQQVSNGYLVLEVAASTTLTATVDGSGCEESPDAQSRTGKWVAREQPVATAGQITRVTLGIGTSAKGTSLRITQELGDGPTVDVQAYGASVLMPSTFDGGKPFTIVLKLEPGTFYVEPHVVVGCPAR
jgi:hypothetical protein